MAKFALPKLALGALLLLALCLAPAEARTTKKRSTTPKKKPAATAPASGVEVPPVAAMTPGLKLPVPEFPPDLTELPLAARGAIVIDAATGETLYEKNADEPQFPASTTKIMTALLVIENGDLDHEVEVTVEDSRVGESSLNIQPGQRFRRMEGLFGLMLKSANDVAWALGRDNAGTVAAFAEKMTQRAKELGATNTNFANPHGLHHAQHYTTPRDLAIIARAAMQQPLFRRIVSTEYYPWPSAETRVMDLKNHNRLLFSFPGCTGVKTGYTYPAQQVLVSAAHWGTREVISVIMHSNRPGIWDDSRMLLTWGLLHPPGTPAPAPAVAGQ